MRSTARREAAITRLHAVKENADVKQIKESFKKKGTKRRRITKEKELELKGLQLQAFEEVDYLMRSYGYNEGVQMDDYWKKVN